MLDPLHVVMLGLRPNLRIVIFSIMRRRSGLMALSVMRDAPVLVKVANPSSQDRMPRGAIYWPCRQRRRTPRERFRPLAQSGH